ncbi:MAG: protein O-mannosyl-transferase, partial [Humisphaera sp.]|nr:protein O-mannosyl-transferase [Humisphaera sp.]
HHPFSTYDDPGYVDESHVRNGLTPANVAWAFTSVHFANWHPLTSLSFMLDRELWPGNARAYHLLSILGHTANGVLLFLVLRSMTGATWRSALVAGLFALHPLRVESVAWIAERKDVLSGFFWILAIGAYTRYARSSPHGLRGPRSSRAAPWYAATIVLFALGLMCKPMVVTLPLVLLLLDYWPLRRSETTSWRKLIVEKTPLLALSAASAVVTMLAQGSGGAVASAESAPMSLRLGNATVAYALYLWKTLWPIDLAALYPLADRIDAWKVASAAAVLVAITFVVIRRRRSSPYLVTGWLWFLGTLVPVIGIVQVGSQALADRYTYLPLIGVAIMIAWGVGELLQRAMASPRSPRSARVARACVAIGCVAVLMLLAVRARHQTHYWADSELLFARVVAIAPDNPIAQFNLGNAYAHKRRFDEAIGCYQRAIELDPGYVGTYNALGMAQLGKNDRAAALAAFREAIRLDPDNADVHNRIGSILILENDLAGAERHVQEALRLEPRYAAALYNLALIERRRGNTAEAERRLNESIRLNGADPAPHHALAQVLHARGDLPGAIAQYRLAVHFDAASPARNNLAWILATTPDAGLRNGPEAVRLAASLRAGATGESPEVLDTLAAAYAEAGDFARAVETAQAAADRATKAGNAKLEQEIRARLALYAEKRAYREAQ